jgi:hypothetical protein
MVTQQAYFPEDKPSFRVQKHERGGWNLHIHSGDALNSTVVFELTTKQLLDLDREILNHVAPIQTTATT